MKIAIGLGSNIEPEKNILQAVLQLSGEYALTSFSNFYYTQPIGMMNKDPFINGVIVIESGHSASIIRQELIEIERDLGRRESHLEYTNKPIDLRILLYGEKEIDVPNLKIPNLHLLDWDFFAYCVSEIEPNWRIPPSMKPIKDLINKKKPLLIAEIVNNYIKEQLWM